MATPLLASQPQLAEQHARPQLAQKPGRATLALFFGLLLAGLAYSAWSLKQDVSASGTVITTVTPFLLLGLALLIALGFEFVNGFHDTANAVATVIYTHALPAPVAVVWSGLCNFLGVLLSSGAVAFGIIALLPVELILQVGSSAGFAMVFALLLAVLCPRLQRRPERHGLDHADSGRHPADGLRAEQDHAHRAGLAVFCHCRGNPPGAGTQCPASRPGRPAVGADHLHCPAQGQPATRNWCRRWRH
ncbi:hypothetical protein ACVWZT_003431 [Pseudomonas sp. TE21394]